MLVGLHYYFDDEVFGKSESGIIKQRQLREKKTVRRTVVSVAFVRR